MTLDVTMVACLEDNYAYVLRCTETGACAVVDPSEAPPVLAALRALDVRPTMVLNTHHHWDHVGGNLEIVERFPGVRVIAHASDRGRVPGQTDAVEGGAEIALGRVVLRALHVPGHTLGAIAWTTEDAAFTGDTLFLGGCGRIFEGDPAMMYASLQRIASSLAPNARVYCGHEYTVKNLRFVCALEPENPSLTAGLRAAEALRASGAPTVPHTLEEELRCNPFLRCDDPALEAAVGVSGGPVAVFAALRERRNAW